MKKLIIGCDADGVLTDMSKFNIENGKIFFRREPINPDAYSIKEMFNCSKLEELLYGFLYYPKYCKRCINRVDSDLVIQKLNLEGNRLYEITARKFATYNNPLGKYIRKLFENWTSKNNMQFERYEYCSESDSPRDKMIACNKLSVDIMIEDKSDVALYLADNGVKVLLFDAPYNKEVRHENIVRVKNWNEIYDIINEFSNSLSENQEFEILNGEERCKLSPLEQNIYMRNYKKYLLNKKFDREQNERFDFKYKLFHNIGMFAMLFNFVKVKGKENIPYQKGMIFASNHLDSYDQFYISKALGCRAIRGLAASSIENTFRGRIFKSLGIKFVDRNDEKSKKEAEEDLCCDLVNENDILIFPEGTRKNKTAEGKLKKIQQFKLGTASIAQKTGSPIIPIAITHNQKFKLIKTTTISFSQPIIVKPTDDIVKVTEELKSDIVAMIDDESPKTLIKSI